MKLFLLASAGGALGAGARYLVYQHVTRLWGAAFPWATLLINISGSLLIGVLVAILLERLPDTTALRVFLITGILGGFTTFSAFSFEVVELIERAEVTYALLYVTGSVVLSVAACWIGLVTTRALLP